MVNVHHLDCGSMCPAFARYSVGDPDGMVSHVLLVETPGAGLVAVDTGFGTEDCRAPRARLGPLRHVIGPKLALAQTLLHRVQALGYAPEDVRHIVPTHLDLDHAGGLSDFPWADVHLSASEHEAAVVRRDLRSRLRYRSAQWAHGPRWKRHQVQGERWKGFEAVRPLPGLEDAVLLIPLAGHTHGHTGVAVRHGDRWLLHAGDAYFDAREIRGSERPAAGLLAFGRMAAMDNSLRLKNVERLSELAATHTDVAMFCAHSRVELRTFAAS